MCQNSVKKTCINKTKQQIKLLIDNISVSNNDEAYQDLQYLLNKLKAQNQPKLKAYDSNIMFSSAKDYQQYQRDKFWKEKAQQNKELLEKSGLWIYSPEYYKLLQKYPKAAKWYKDLFGNIKDCKVKITYQLIQDLDAYNAVDVSSEVIDLMKQQYVYMWVNQKYPNISSAYFMRKLNVSSLECKEAIDIHLQTIARQLRVQQVNLAIMAGQMKAVMNQIGDAYTQIQPDGTIVISAPDTLQPIVKVYNQKNANHYIAPIKVYYKGEFDGEKTSRHIAIV